MRTRVLWNEPESLFVQCDELCMYIRFSSFTKSSKKYRALLRAKVLHLGVVQAYNLSIVVEMVTVYFEFEFC